MIDAQKTGWRLQDHRIEAGYKQKDVAEILDIYPTTVSKWECGARTPTLDGICKLARLYNVYIEDLVVEVDIENE